MCLNCNKNIAIAKINENYYRSYTDPIKSIRYKMFDNGKHWKKQQFFSRNFCDSQWLPSF